MELHTPEAHEAITAELVACTLGQRRHADRLELRMDMWGRILCALRSVRAWRRPDPTPTTLGPILTGRVL